MLRPKVWPGVGDGRRAREGAGGSCAFRLFSASRGRRRPWGAPGLGGYLRRSPGRRDRLGRRSRRAQEGERGVAAGDREAGMYTGIGPSALAARVVRAVRESPDLTSAVSAT